LVAELIDDVVNLIKLGQQLMPSVRLDHAVELLDIDKDNCHLTFFFTEVLLALSDLVPDQAGNEDVQDALELEERSHSSVSVHELGLLLQLLDVDVAAPDQ